MNNLKNVTIIPNYDIEPNAIEPNAIEPNAQNSEQSEKSKIPRSLHMIWVGENKAPEYVNTYFLQWKELMPEWSIILWENKDITTQHFPQEIVDLISWTNKGAQKADIMRYFIIEKYGGFYVDTDVIPFRSFDLLLNKWNNAGALICHDLELTWEYISIGFFGSIPNHPVFRTACELVYQTIVNTEDIHFKTGPHLFGKAVAFTEFEKNDVILLPTNYFYRNLDYPYRFGHHFYSKIW
jgi:mannosyltransferase OCH1-like enzyme